MENIEYKPLTSEEIVYSGSFARKIYKYINQLDVTKTGVLKISCKGKDMLISGPPTILNWLDNVIVEETNKYLENIISKVENEEYRNYILKFSQNEDSRKSSFHIFNIEVLCYSANSKPEKFPFILNCVTDAYTLTHDIENYEFYVFAILDAPTNEVADEILEALLEREISRINFYDPEIKKITNIPKYVESILSPKALELVYENLDKIRIM